MHTSAYIGIHRDTASNVPECNINNTNIDHYTSTNRQIIVYYETKTNQMTATRANALLVFCDALLYATLTTGRPKLPPSPQAV